MPRRRLVETGVVAAKVPKEDLEQIDYLIEIGLFPNRGEVVRTALWKFLDKYRSQEYPAREAVRHRPAGARGVRDRGVE
ncbi:MAG: ribbon-helix-helix domain-containing protein [Pyrobaculum sp.]